ncbi:MAG: sugar phosphate isomerase/epimerase [Dehalococcoidia bacterium]
MSALPRPALSTMWAVQPRFERDLDAFVRRAAELGFAGIEVNHGMDAWQLREAFEAAGRYGLEVTSLHAPAPLELVEAFDGRENRTLNLAALDEAERGTAVEHHLRSLEVAAAHEVGRVVVHLGGIGALDESLASERWLRTHFDRRERPDIAEEWDERLEAARAERASVAPPWFEAARRSLAELAARAADLGVTMGLESRLRYHEFPLPEECANLVAPYAASVVGYWHDTGHAEVLARIGVVPLASWFPLTEGRLVGVHVSDVRGLRDHYAPGAGDLDFEALAPHLDASALRTFEVDQNETDAALARALEVTRAAGIMG